MHKNRTSKHIKQKLMGLWSSNIVEDLDVPFPVIHRLWSRKSAGVKDKIILTNMAQVIFIEHRYFYLRLGVRGTFLKKDPIFSYEKILKWKI